MAIPTPHQQAILDLLTDNEYLTTRQIGEALPHAGRERAQRALLARLARQGWVRAAPLYPERGAASERYWTLTPAGAQVLGITYQAPQQGSLAEIRHTVNSTACDAVGVGANQARVLHLLAEWKQLTTRQIWQTLDAAQPRWATQQRLRALQRKQMVRGSDLHPTQGTASEHYWMLLERGATAIGIAYHQQYRRRPTSAALHYRGVQLQLRAVVAAAGWQLLSPHPAEGHPTRPEPLLIAAVLAQEQHALATLLAQGHSRSSLQARLDRLEHGLVGATVPAQIPDYVAYLPGHPRCTAVLILPPPSATRSFWSQSRPPVRGSAVPLRLSRTEWYARLAPVIPVLGLFETADAAHHYAPLLQRSGLQAQIIAGLGTWLTTYQVNMTHPP